MFKRGIQRVSKSVRVRYRNLYKRFIVTVDSVQGRCYPVATGSIARHLTLDEKQALYKLARSVPKASPSTEIGSYYGAGSNCLVAGLIDGHGDIVRS